MAIPASQIVNVTPRLIAAGGTDLVMNGLLLTTNSLIPTSGMVVSFTSADDVGAYFGTTSGEYDFAARYFLGYDNSFKKPKALLCALRVLTAQGAWLRGGKLTADLATLTAVTDGSMEITIDGTLASLSSIDLSSATSLSAVAAEITTALGAAGTCTYSSFTGAFQINSATTGAASTITFASAAASGTDLSDLLCLTQNKGAILSPGLDAMTVADNFAAIKTETDNFVSFSTLYDATDDETLALAAWATAQGVDYLYVPWSTEATLLDATSVLSIAALLRDANAGATAGVYGSSDYAAFVMGAVASIDWDRINGVINLAHKGQTGLAPNVMDAQSAVALEANNWNFYGNYATRNDNFYLFFPGCMFGQYKFIDPYVNAIWLKNVIQVSCMAGLASVGRVPYNDAGYAIIRAWLVDPVNRALRNGTIDVGVALSESQKAQLIQEAGEDISEELFVNGFVIRIDDPGASVRVNRASPTISLWYTYGGGVNRLEIASTAIL